MRTALLAVATIAALLLFTSTVGAVPVLVEFQDGPQDPLFVREQMHELGDLFPSDERIVTNWWDPTGQTACFDSNDDLNLTNILVSMTNVTSTTWYNVHYVADPETTITNFDGYIGNFGLNDAEEAFRIDNIGINQPLVFESMIVDNIFQPGEEWHFIIQDFTNSLQGFPGPFDSIGIASLSSGLPSTGSIIADAVPIPAAFWLLGTGLIGLGALRRRFRR